MKTCLLAAMLMPLASFAQMTAPRPPLGERIGHTDLSKVEPAHSDGSVGLTGYQVVLTFSSEALRQKWNATDTHKQLWPILEGMLTDKNYSRQLYEVY